MTSLLQYRFQKSAKEAESRAELIHQKLDELKKLMHQDERFRELGFTLETVDNYVVRHLT